MVFATVQPAIRPLFKRDLQRRQHPIKIFHDLRIGEPDNAKASLTCQHDIALLITRHIVGVTIDLDHKPLGRTEEVRDAPTDAT